MQILKEDTLIISHILSYVIAILLFTILVAGSLLAILSVSTEDINLLQCTQLLVIFGLVVINQLVIIQQSIVGE